MFKRVLIANRGEIACRIISAAKALGIETVAVYSEADRYAKHVKLADMSFSLGESDVLASYLNSEKIISIAQLAQVQAIHPGYGLLSENADFAKACEKNHIIFIGPHSETIAQLADKAKAKKLAASLSIPVIESVDVPEKITDEWICKLDTQARWIIKACAGGGGKGMRLIDKNTQDIQTTLDLAKKEALHYFNHDAIILERYIQPTRHIEVQLLADHQGKVIHLFDRDCSMQRRYQKVIEIAPALNIDPFVKEAMYSAAMSLAKAVGYVNAGTVEFLLDEDQHFYFLEMNTRLQVEHGVTENITHQDIVQKQFQIAAGLPILEEQSDFKIDGVAIEVRLCAEIPENNFMPSAGTITELQWPKYPFMRIDSGYEKGDVITPYYDSMIAKMIVHGKDYQEAVSHLQMGIHALHIRGIQTNQDWISKIIHETFFLKHNLVTNALDQYHPDKQTDFSAWVAPALLMLSQRFSFSNEQKNNPWYRRAQVTNRNQCFRGIIYSEQNKPIALRILEKSEKHFEVSCESETLGVLCIDLQSPSSLSFHWNNQMIKAFVHIHQNHASVRLQGSIFRFKLYPSDEKNECEYHSGELHAQLPGSVVKVLVCEGNRVQKGDRLLVMEAMKMEHAVFAPFNGVIKKIKTEEGARVCLGQELMIMVQD